jgi:hypothetical protein
MALAYGGGSVMRALIVVTTSLIVAVAGCSGQGASSAPATGSGDVSRSGTTELSGDQSYDALDFASHEADARSLSASVERGLITVSGLEKVLGGPAKADAAYTSLVKAVDAETVDWIRPHSFGRFGAFTPTDDPAGAALSVMFSALTGLVMNPESMVVSSNELAPGQSVSIPDSGLGTITGTTERVLADGSKETTSAGLTAKMQIHMDLVPCPEKDGTFTAKASMSTSILTTDGSYGITMSLDSSVKGTVNDDAELASSEGQGTTSSGTVTGSKPSKATFTVSRTIAGGKVTGATVRPTLGTLLAPDKLIENTADLANMLESFVNGSLLKAAEKGWKSGRCVSLEPTTAPAQRTRLKPAATAIITAQPKSKVDGWPVGGTVKATLSGESAVDPAGTKVPSVARFTYTAPNQKDKTGTVSLEERSKRGVAKADVSFNTNSTSYEAVGGLDEFQGTGTICSLSQPFRIEGSGVTHSYFPTSDTGGTYEYFGTMSGFKVKGKGTYTVKADDKGGTLTATGTGQVKTPAGAVSASGTETYTLTPTDKCQ